MSNWKVCGQLLLENLGYTFGFIIVMARQQLFTENTVTAAVLPSCKTWKAMSNVGLLIRLWGVVLLGNILGTVIAAWAFEYMPIFNEETRDAFVKIGHGCDEKKHPSDVANAIISWLADRHYGLDVSCSGCGKDCGDYIDGGLLPRVTPPISWSVLLKSLSGVLTGNAALERFHLAYLTLAGTSAAAPLSSR